MNSDLKLIYQIHYQGRMRFHFILSLNLICKPGKCLRPATGMSAYRNVNIHCLYGSWNKVKVAVSRAVHLQEFPL